MKSKGIFAVLCVYLGGCAIAPLSQSDIQAKGTPTLCTALAETVLTGQPAPIDGRVASEDTLIAELKTRHELCEPWRTYVYTAQQRIEYRMQQQAMQQQAAANLMSAGVVLQSIARPVVLGAPPPPQSTQTVCHTDAFGRTVCDTTGN